MAVCTFTEIAEKSLILQHQLCSVLVHILLCYNDIVCGGRHTCMIGPLGEAFITEQDASVSK